MRTLALLLLLGSTVLPQEVTGQDLDKVLERADKLLEESKSAYEAAREKSSVQGFIEAGFKLEEARLKFIVLQEIGSPEKQKIAADRMRAANQLGKLIHDGKVAISGAPAASSAPEPPAAPAAPGAPAPPAPTAPSAKPPVPAAPPVDVSKRAPLPDASKIRETEKLVRDLFKDQYAKKAPADQRALARMLIENAQRSPDDLAAVWVLCREAQEIAARNADCLLAFAAIDVAAQALDVDVHALKTTALASAAKAAASPEDISGVTRAHLDFVDELLRSDQFETADKIASAALQLAKRGKDMSLFSKAAARSKDTAECKARFLSLKRAFEVLAKSPEDPAASAEIGQFLCFSKGSWDLGLRYLAKSPDASLRALAEKDLALPLDPAARAAIADGWWELADKEKNAFRKTQIQGHVRELYESALPDASGILRVKIDKRLSDLEDLQQGTGINLLRLIDPMKDAVVGEWAMEKGHLLTPLTFPSWTRLQIPYAAPAEYDLSVAVTTSEPFFCLRVGLALGGDRQCMVVIGGEDGRASALEMIDNRSWNDSNPTYGATPMGRSAAILFSIRKAGVTVTLDGKKIIDWKEMGRLSLFGGWQVPNRNSIFLAPSSGRFSINQLLLTPVSGQGKRLR